MDPKAGRDATLIALGYLAMVAVMLAYAVYDARLAENPDAGLAGTPVLVVTGPFSFILRALFDRGPLYNTMHGGILAICAAALIQAAILRWVLVRFLARR